MSTTTEFERHPETGHPVQPYPDFQPGDLVTEAFLSDAYPAVVVHRTPKTVWVASVAYQLANVSRDDVPGYNGYGDSATLVIDPESAERAVAKGKEGAKKYVLRVSPARPGDSINDREKYGEPFHRTGWRLPNSAAGSVQPGARYRQDPHV